MKLGEKISILRKARGFSQEQLGLSLASKDNGVSRQTVSDWETGKTEPKLDNIRALAGLLNVSYDALLDETLDLNNPEYLNEVLSNGASKSSEVLSENNYFIYKRIYGVVFILLALLVLGVGLGLMIPALGEANKYFAESAARNGNASIMGQNFHSQALTWLSVAIVGGAIMAIGIPVSLVLWIWTIRKKKSVGVLNNQGLTLYPLATKEGKTIRLPLAEIEGIEKDKLSGVCIKAKEEVHLANIKQPKGLMDAFASLK